MFWADGVADEIIKSGKYKPYWVDDMKTPSGRIHVGALRGVVVHELVRKALKDKGVEATYTYVFEDHDPMDDIPSYLPREKYEQYLGMPLFKIPSPEPGFENYARFYAHEFEKTFRAMGCTPEIIWTKDLYTKGLMNDVIKEVLDNAKEVRKIYFEMYKKELPSNWYPFQLYCPKCGKVSTTEVSDWDGKEVSYECIVDKVKWTKGCGDKGKTSPFSSKDEMKGKLPWKVEWACKWKVIGVTIEGAGKDHMSSGGSHDLASLICTRVINYPVPFPVPYEWLLIGGRKMSSSRGVGISAHEMLDILPAEIIRFLMVKIKVNTQINFDPSEKDTIPNLFDEYQKAYEEYKKDPKSDLGRIFELSQVSEKVKAPPTEARFQNLVQLVQMPDKDGEIKRLGFEEWAKYARIWVDRYAPESEKFTILDKLPGVAKDLSSKQKELLKNIADKLDKSPKAEQFQTDIYEMGKELGLDGKETFAAIYLSLIGKTYGPRAAWLILSQDKDFVKKRFNEV